MSDRLGSTVARVCLVVLAVIDAVVLLGVCGMALMHGSMAGGMGC